MTKDKNNLDDLKAQLQQAKKPTGAGAKTKSSRDTDSARRVVDNTLQNVRDGKTEGINDIFLQSLKRIREESEGEYMQVGIKYQQIRQKNKTIPTWASLNRQAKIYKKSRKPTDSDNGASDAEPRSKADKLTELIRQNAVLFHDEDKEAYIHCRVDNPANENSNASGEHYEIWSLHSEGFKDYAGYLFLETYDAGIGDSAMREAIDNLSAVAKYKGEMHSVHLRYAIKDDAVYIDLCNDQWQVVVIDETGWQIKENKDIPIKFTRESHMRPINTPIRGGSLDLLWDAFTIKDQDTKYMLCAWLLDSMLTDTDYLMLEVGGEAGSAKSMTQDRIRSLLDPSKGNLLVYSGKLDDLPVIARHSYIISFENMSKLSTQMQDKFCSMCTGAATATRSLHTTHDISIWGVKRPIIINGIVDLATREDMLQRTVCLELPRIEKNGSKKELRELWEKQRPEILGALYDLLSKVLFHRDKVAIKSSTDTRQTDFLVTGQAMFSALDVDESFPDLFNKTTEKVVERSLNYSPVSLALVKMIEKEGTFRGSMNDLLEKLSNQYRPNFYDSKAWAKSPEGLSNILKRQASPLRKRGIIITKQRTNKKRIVMIEQTKDKAASTSTTRIEI